MIINDEMIKLNKNLQNINSNLGNIVQLLSVITKQGITVPPKPSNDIKRNPDIPKAPDPSGYNTWKI